MAYRYLFAIMMWPLLAQADMISLPSLPSVPVGYTFANLEAYPDYQLYLIIVNPEGKVKEKITFETGKDILYQLEAQERLRIVAVSKKDTTKILPGGAPRTEHTQLGKKVKYVVDVMHIVVLDGERFEWETRTYRYHYHAQTKKGAVFGNTWLDTIMIFCSSLAFIVFVALLKKKHVFK